MNFDLFLLNIINNFASKSDILDFVFIFLAKYLGYLLIVLIFLFLFINFKKYKFLPALAFISGFLARYGIVEAIRFFYYRPRPFIEFELTPLFEHADTSSFPSGHTAFFFAFSIIVFLYNKKAGWFFFAGSFLIGFSRVAAGIHWPFDILAGALVGILAGYLIWLFSLKKRKIIQKT